MHAIGPSDIRDANALSCLQALRFAERPVTLSDLTGQTGLSRPTVESAVAGFEQLGLVREVAADGGGASGGRPARRYVFEPRAGVVAGVDAGPNGARVIITDLSGGVLAEAVLPLEREDGDERRDVVIELIERTLADAGAEPSDLRAIGLALSGIVDHDGTVRLTTLVPGWTGRDIAAELSAHFGCVAFAENDVKLAALAEHHFGVARDVGGVVFLSVERWITLAFTMNAEIFHGAHRTAGEVGSRRDMRWSTNTQRSAPRWASAASAADVVALALAGDSAAAAELTGFLDDITPTLATVVLTIDPDLIVIGGALADAEGTIVAGIESRLRDSITLDAVPGVSRSRLGARGITLGALATAFRDGSEALFGIGGAPVPPVGDAPAEVLR